MQITIQRDIQYIFLEIKDAVWGLKFSRIAFQSNVVSGSYCLDWCSIIFHLQSLPNLSKSIRWSLDLRWQRPSEPVGFYGLKEGLLMRSSKDPDMKIDWTSFDAINRHDKQTAAMTGKVWRHMYHLETNDSFPSFVVYFPLEERKEWISWYLFLSEAGGEGKPKPQKITQFIKKKTHPVITSGHLDNSPIEHRGQWF